MVPPGHAHIFKMRARRNIAITIAQFGRHFCDETALTCMSKGRTLESCECEWECRGEAGAEREEGWKLGEEKSIFWDGRMLWRGTWEEGAERSRQIFHIEFF